MQETAMQDRDMSRRMERLEKLLAEIETAGDPATRARVREIVQTLMDFHGEALERLLTLIADRGEPGQQMIDAVAGDERVSAMLVLYGLHPLDVRGRVEYAIAKVRPYLAQHSGDAELIGVSPEGVVTLRLKGNCHGCPSSRSTLTGLIEGSILTAAPEVTEIRVEEEKAQEESGFLPVSAVKFNGCPMPAVA